jgi:transposase
MVEAATNKQATLVALRKLLEQGQTDEVLTLFASLLDNLGHLSLEVARLKRSLVGRKSEKLDPNQLSLMLELLGAAQAEGAAAAETNDKPLPKPPLPRNRQGHGRKPLPDDLPREVIDLKPPASALTCEQCGEGKTCIGHDSAVTIDFVPAQIKVIETRRHKYACRACESAVVIAPKRAQVIDKGLAEAGLLAHVIVSKYADHNPLNRIRRILQRSGVDLPISTLTDWVAYCGDLLEPLVRRIGELALESHLLQSDDTGIKVVDQDSPNGTKRGHLWGHLGDRRWAYFDYTPTRDAEGPYRYLKHRKGWLQVDAYSGYDRLFRGEQATAVEVGCWAHTRRYFFEVVQSGDHRAAIALDKIAKLYAVERKATEQQLGPEARAKLRQEESEPIINELMRWVVDTYNEEPPKSALRRGLTYTLNQYQALRKFLEDGRLPLDNNDCERELRAVAVGRKNYLFAGSDAAARRSAVFYSLIGTCKHAGVEPWAYLRDVMQRIADGWPQRRLDELLPPNWSPVAG